MRTELKTQSRLLRKYVKAYVEGRVPKTYTDDSPVTYTVQFRGKVYDIPLPKHNRLQEAVAASKG